MPASRSYGPGHNVDPKTLTRFIMESVSCSQQGTDLAFILNSVSVACKVIANAVTMAGIQSLHALEGGANATGDDQKTLDVLSNDVMINALRSSRKVGAMVSEEDPEALIFTEDTCQSGVKYALVFDPLDGSSNIECNVSVGTIFGVYRCADSENPTAEDCMQPGSAMICAGYVLYSSACIMVLSTGIDSGVHSFTIDPTFGEFVESSSNPIVIPKSGGKRIYSINAGNSELWDLPTSEFVRWTKRQKNRYSLRYIGSMVADVHRTLLYGGIFMYPADFLNRSGKLRLIYECFPMAFLVEAAGGKASTGTGRILDLKPTSIHQRSPIFIGCKRDVDKVEELYSRIPNMYGMHFSPLDDRAASRLGKNEFSREKVSPAPTEPIKKSSRSRAPSVEPPTKRMHWAISVAEYALLEDYDGDAEHFQLSGQKGDIYTELCKMNDPKWVMATNELNQRGLLPTRLLAAMTADKSAGDAETAINSFKGDPDNHEIDFVEGDVAVSIRHCNDARWCYAKNGRTGQSGIVPASLFGFARGRKRFTGEEITKHLKAAESGVDNTDDPECHGRKSPKGARWSLTDTFSGDIEKFELSGGKGDTFTDVQLMQDPAWVSAKSTSGKRGLLPANLLVALDDESHCGATKSVITCPSAAVCYRMTEDYEADLPGVDGEKFQVLKGEVFTGVELTDDKRWSSVTTGSGARGTVPTKALERLNTATLHFVAAKHHPAGNAENTIEFDIGDVAVDVSRCVDKKWINATNATTGERGIVLADIFNLPVSA